LGGGGDSSNKAFFISDGAHQIKNLYSHE
jgi:hypothetical protein